MRATDDYEDHTLHVRTCDLTELAAIDGGDRRSTSPHAQSLGSQRTASIPLKAFGKSPHSFRSTCYSPRHGCS